VVVNAEMRNWVFVKVETDQTGLYGWGEASLEWKTRAVAGAVEDFAPMVLGEDPTRIEHLYQKLYRQSFWRMGVIGMSAISAIEQACWDITGKWLGVPVYKLLGGAVRDRVRMYTHLGGGDMKSVYETFDPEPRIDLARQVVQRGYTAVKVVFVPYSEPLMGADTVKRFASLMERLRLALGSGIDIMIDFHGRTYPAMAIAYINAIEEYRPFFCEEPAPPENVDALAQVRAAVPARFSGGLREGRLPRDPAGPVPLRRVVGGQEDRGDGRDLHDGGCAAQPPRPGSERGRAALRAVDAEFPDPGGHADRRAVAVGSGRACARNEGWLLAAGGAPRAGDRSQ
jgi:galactonate dehydratase